MHRRRIFSYPTASRSGDTAVTESHRARRQNLHSDGMMANLLLVVRASPTGERTAKRKRDASAGMFHFAPV